MNKRAFSYDITEYEKGIVYANSKEEAEEKVRNRYSEVIDMDKFDFYVSEIDLNSDDDIIVIVPW